MKKILFFSSIIGMFLGVQSMAGTSKDVQTVDSVDLNKYIGKWFEVASIPQSFQKKCVGNTTAEYAFADNDLISVVNSCDTNTGERSVAEGRAKVEDAKTNSKLKVTFVKFFDWVFAFGGKYWVIDIDSGYNYALIGNPSRDYAWILSRTPSLPIDVLIQSEKHFKDQGYDTCKILSSIQSSGFSERKPICEIVKGLK